MHDADFGVRMAWPKVTAHAGWPPTGVRGSSTGRCRGEAGSDGAERKPSRIILIILPSGREKELSCGRNLAAVLNKRPGERGGVLILRTC